MKNLEGLLNLQLSSRNARIWSGFKQVLESNPIRLENETKEKVIERFTQKFLQVVDDEFCLRDRSE